MAPELKAILQQRQARDIGGRAGGFHLGDDGCQLVRIYAAHHRSLETLQIAYRSDSGNARGASDSFQIRACTGRGWETSNRKQTFVIENNVNKISRSVTRHSAKASKIHQKRAVAIQDDDLLLRHAEGKAQPRGRCKSHRMLQIEE